jgi:hypothetical protein
MNTFLSNITGAFLFALATAVANVPALAGPGAHGPGGEHLDAPGATASSANTRPRIEAKSELFELVGHLHADELSVMINRFETNEPVLDAKVEVSSGSVEALAKFRSDHGDYAVDDTAFLKVLSAPGEHPLIFTIVAGTDSDLLEGTLTVNAAQAQDASHGHSHTLEYVLMGLAVLAAVVVGVALLRRRRMRYASSGGLS